MSRKYLSGWQKKQAKRARDIEALRVRATELGLALPEPVTSAAPSPPPTEAATAAEASIDELLRSVGPPPEDPLAQAVWGGRFAALIAWLRATVPEHPALSARLRGALDALRILGLTSTRAIERDRLLRIERRLGLAEQETSNDALETRPGSAPPALRDRGRVQ